VATAEAEKLYGLPLEEFTAARDELARSLREDGRRDEAAEVAALRKPVVAAWVVNRLARDARDDVKSLVEAAKGIRSGREGAEGDFREALERLTASAREILVGEKRSPDAVLQQVAGTLRAGAASDPELLLAGTLAQPIEATGFGAMADASLAPPKRRGHEEKSERPKVDRRAVERARKALAAARDEARSLERAATAAEREARKARDAAEQAGDRVAEAEARLADARGA
jgi:hypothetical protein